MNIYIDIKENKNFINILNKFIKFEIKSLDLGDIIFSFNDINILIIERKTVNDLAASINDGRYHEQKIRLKSSKTRIIYLIEGEYTDMNNIFIKNFDNEKYKGCIINSIIRDNIHVYLTKNMEDSAIFLADISKRLPKYGNNIIKEINDKCISPLKVGEEDVLISPPKVGGITQNDINYSNAIKSKKKDNITHNVCFINQLKQIPGVSTNISQNIVNIYGSFNKLIESYQYENIEKKKENMLKDIKVNNRKIGPILSKRIYNYLFAIE